MTTLIVELLQLVIVRVYWLYKMIQDVEEIVD
jgi:hypothetical protein